MRLSELLHSHVVDAAGEDVGSVDDVRLVQDGPLLEPFGAALRVEGLVVGHWAIGIRLGYLRADVKGPWLLRRIFGALEQRARYVPWELVESVEDGLVRVKVSGGELEPPPTS